MRKLLGLAAAAAIVSTAGFASAAPVNLSFDGMTHGPIANNVNISMTPVGTTGNKVAGGFKMSDNGNVLDDFIAFCLDIGNIMKDDTLYQVTLTPFSNYAIPIARVQAVFDANYATVDLTNVDQSAGFQLALWNAIYDTDFDLATGTFRGTGLAAGTTTAAQGFLNAANGYVGGQKFKLTFYESLNQPRSQNLVTATAIPLPAGGLLLLTAFGAFAVVRRRKAAA